MDELIPGLYLLAHASVFLAVGGVVMLISPALAGRRLNAKVSLGAIGAFVGAIMFAVILMIPLGMLESALALSPEVSGAAFVALMLVGLVVGVGASAWVVRYYAGSDLAAVRAHRRRDLRARGRGLRARRALHARGRSHTPVTAPASQKGAHP